MRRGIIKTGLYFIMVCSCIIMCAVHGMAAENNTPLKLELLGIPSEEIKAGTTFDMKIKLTNTSGKAVDLGKYEIADNSYYGYIPELNGELKAGESIIVPREYTVSYNYVGCTIEGKIILYDTDTYEDLTEAGYSFRVSDKTELQITIVPNFDVEYVRGHITYPVKAEVKNITDQTLKNIKVITGFNDLDGAMLPMQSSWNPAEGVLIKTFDLEDSEAYQDQVACISQLEPGETRILDGAVRLRNSFEQVYDGYLIGVAEIYKDEEDWSETVAGAPVYYVRVRIVPDCEKNQHNLAVSIKKATTDKNGMSVTKCTLCGEVVNSTVIYRPKTVLLSAESYTYNGKVKKPAVTVKDSNGKTIDKSNYTVSYSKGCKNVGRYTVKITFRGDSYSGSMSDTFDIRPGRTSLSKIKGAKRAFTVTWKKQKKQTTGYQIQYSTDKGFKRSTKLITVKKNKIISRKISKLKTKKKYYVRIRTYKTVKINGKSMKLYSGWSKVKIVTTK